MQQYYNQVAEQKRIAFIDNLTDAQAQELSEHYPFAICFANNTTDDHPLPVIWHNNKRYGFSNVAQTSITVGDCTLSLQLNDDGEICLVNNVNNFTLSHTGTLTVASAGSTVTANLPNEDYTNLNWTITGTNNSYFKFEGSSTSNVTGKSVKVLPTNIRQAQTINGTLSNITSTGNQNSINGNIYTIKGTFTPGTATSIEYNAKLNATYNDITKDVSLKYVLSDIVKTESQGTYTWTILENIPDYINVNTTSTNTITIDNTSYQYSYTFNAGTIKLNHSYAPEITNASQIVIGPRARKCHYAISVNNATFTKNSVQDVAGFPQSTTKTTNNENIYVLYPSNKNVQGLIGSVNGAFTEDGDAKESGNNISISGSTPFTDEYGTTYKIGHFSGVDGKITITIKNN